jgi:hypothetical protein
MRGAHWVDSRRCSACGTLRARVKGRILRRQNSAQTVFALDLAHLQTAEAAASVNHRVSADAAPHKKTRAG